jgi:hypothetical protein
MRIANEAARLRAELAKTANERDGQTMRADAWKGSADSLRAELDETRRERDEARVDLDGIRGDYKHDHEKLVQWRLWAVKTIDMSNSMMDVERRALIDAKLAAAKPERLGRRETVLRVAHWLTHGIEMDFDATIDRLREAGVDHLTEADLDAVHSDAIDQLRAYAATLPPDTEPVFTRGDVLLLHAEADRCPRDSSTQKAIRALADKISELVQSREEAGR